MSLLVNIRGCNGAGKSTIPIMMIKADLDSRIEGQKGQLFTVCPNYGWVILGTYLNKTGGLDTYKNNEAIKSALASASELYPNYDLLMEGVIASTIKSTYAKLFREYSNRRQILVISFVPPLEICLQRVYSRNGGKPIKEDIVASKWNTVNRNVSYFQQEGFDSIRVNTAKVPREQMLNKFIQTVDKYRKERPDD